MARKGVIIVARASADCGKTTAIRSIRFYLNKNNAKVISEQEFGSPNADKPKDIRAVLEYQGVRIGISSMGDPGINQETILDEFIKTDCRIILCAGRKRGQMIDAVEALKENWEIRYVRSAEYGFVSVDTLWKEVIAAIRLINFAYAV